MDDEKLNEQNNKNGKKNKSGVKFSIKYRILLLVIGTILFMGVLMMAYVIPMAKKSQQTSVENSMNELAEMSAKSVDLQYKAKQDVTTNDLTELLSGIHIEGVSTSYLYVVNKEDKFVYHKRQEKIGTEVT